MTKILYHDVTNFISRNISRYSKKMYYIKIFEYLGLKNFIIFIILVTNVNIKLIQA